LLWRPAEQIPQPHGKIVEQDETFKVFGFGMAELKVWWAMWELKALYLSHPLRPISAW
jgi:hypothetical protein